MAILSSLSDDLAAVVESAGRGVVRVEGRRGGAASGTVWAPEGLIVTANHVLTRDDSIGVGLGDGKTIEAALIGRDMTTDLALLRIGEKIAPVADWTAVDGVRVGHLVLALGRPGKTVRAALGIVSTLGGSWRTSAGGKVDHYVQADASSYPGFSGGPLVSVEGKTVGVNTSALVRGATVTIPTSTVRSVVDELLKRGRVSRGYLGVGIQPVRLPAGLARQTGQETGLLLVSVEPESPGERAGLTIGDTLLAVEAEPVRHWDDLLAVLSKDRIGRSVAIRILRAGQVQEITATVGEHP